MTAEEACGLNILLTDIDDTLTNDGLLFPEAYAALWRLFRSGIKVVPVTGRPAGWCDLIIRQWPVDAVIGENGAFVLYKINGKPKYREHPLVNPSLIREKKRGILEELRTEVPLARVALDQDFRKFDLAIDFAEDEPKLGLDEAVKIKSICEKNGAVAKISSIHVNTWFGDYDKVSMASLFLKEHYHVDLNDPESNSTCIFFGDSPNDEPMFKSLRYSCAVGDFNRYLPMVKHLPSFLSVGSGGIGFFEAVNVILELRSSVGR